MGADTQLPRIALATALLTVVSAQTPDQRKTGKLEFRFQLVYSLVVTFT